MAATLVLTLMPMVFLLGMGHFPMARCIRAAGWCSSDYGAGPSGLEETGKKFPAVSLRRVARPLAAPAPARGGGGAGPAKEPARSPGRRRGAAGCGPAPRRR